MRRPTSAVGHALIAALLATAAAFAQIDTGAATGERGPSRVREGGTPQPEHRIIEPYSIRLDTTLDIPTSGVVASPPEFAPMQGVLFSYITGQWTQVVTAMVAELTKPGYDEIAYVMVRSAAEQSAATTAFQSAGADMSKVQFMIMNMNALWCRDWGPHYTTHGDALVIVDSHYYPTRPLDNFGPVRLAQDFWQIPLYDVGLYYSGGNFQADSLRNGYVTQLVNVDNPASQGFDNALIGEFYKKFQGIDTLHIFGQLPGSVDGTGHIDMWLYLIDDNRAIVSEFIPGSNQTAINITNAGAAYLENTLGYTVWRTPAWNVGSTHYTYTNAFRINNRIFLCVYGTLLAPGGNSAYNDRDAQAYAAWQAAAPELTLVPIQCNAIIPAAGAIHCIVKQVPRRVVETPAVQVVWPDGDDVLNVGSTYEIVWGAFDNKAVTAVDLYYSTDGGATYPHVIALGEANDSRHTWTVPDTPSGAVRVRVEAHDADGNVGVGVSASDSRIVKVTEVVYDFSVNAGVDRWGWGNQTGSWANINANRTPVATQLTGANYTGIAASDNQYYTSQTPTGSNETTHVFEFTIAEPLHRVRDIGVRWEGQAAACNQMSLHVWDDVLGNWTDARTGLTGQNRYMDSAAYYQRDAILSGNLNVDIGRYLTNDGKLTVLLYGQRSASNSVHDHVQVTVLVNECAGDFDDDGAVTQVDLGILLANYGCTGDCAGDVDGDGDVDQSDLGALLANFGQSCL